MRLIALLAAAFLAAGCVYRIDVQQGNFVTQEAAAKLKVGMTRAQVRQLLGTPLLSDVFHANRWDYHFSHSRGRKAEERTTLTVIFENDKVVSFTGEARPAGASTLAGPSETRR